jgi:hypothetical protein
MECDREHEPGPSSIDRPESGRVYVCWKRPQALAQSLKLSGATGGLKWKPGATGQPSPASASQVALSLTPSATTRRPNALPSSITASTIA